jgi:hypothetical protein
MLHIMFHTKIENEDMVERYARNQLTPEERQAFEEHFFGCDECFAKLQSVEAFVAGIRDASARGLLNDQPAAAASPSIWIWAFAGAMCVAVLCGIIGWKYLTDSVALRLQLARATDQLQTEQLERSKLAASPTTVEMAEANVPVAMLQGSRAGEASAIVLQPGARHLVLWIEPGPSRYRNFRVDVFSRDNHLVSSLDHLAANRYGAVTASLPTNQLPSGDFRITLTGQDPPPAALAGEYRLQVRRP